MSTSPRILAAGLFAASLGLLGVAAPSMVAAPAPSLMENLGRGVVAVRSNTTQAYIGWRMLGTDPSGISFNLYRTSGSAEPVKLNESPLAATTDFTDTPPNFTDANVYTVKPVVNGVEGDGTSFTLAANVAVRQYISVPMQVPPGGTEPSGSNYTYSANDASVADLDGDGEYEFIVKWDPSDAKDTASTGYAGPQILDAYKRDGTRMWRINLGRNIRSGAHYTQFIVYDLDGDGKAELVCKTADASVDGVGTVIGNPLADYRSTETATLGRVLAGPEFLTVFNGETGAAMATTDYIAGRDPIGGWGGPGGNNNNDSVGNRVDRFLATVAYLDGVRPSVVMARGYYGRSVLWAVDWRNGQLSTRWVFDSSLPPWNSHPITYTGTPAGAPLTRASTFSGQGGHHVWTADVDGDGKDEVVYHSMVVNSDGTGRVTTGMRHGDAGNIADIIPARPGLEVFGIHENEGTSTTFRSPGIAVYDSNTGEVIWSANPAEDTGRGRSADIDPNFPGMETWGGTGGTRRGDTGATIYTQTPGSNNFVVWWDADLLRELEDGTTISKWNPTTRTTQTLMTASGAASNNGTKSTPALIADVFGDWREEVIWRSSNSSELRIYTTTIPANNRFWTFMHDRKYRESIAWQNVGYNQPADPSFFVGADMAPQPAANIVTQLDTTPPVLTFPETVTAEATSAAGAVVAFTASAVDAVSGPATVTFSQASGTVFPIGTTAVAISATDAYGNKATGTISVVVTATPATNVTAQLQIVSSGLRLNRATQRYAQTVTVKNTSGQPITGPVSLVFDQLSASATLAGATGITGYTAPLGSPYLDLNIGADAVLSPGETITVAIEFANSSNQAITYTPRALAGSGIR